MHILTEYDSIPVPIPTEAFVLGAIEYDDSYYQARTDRNLGWITPEEQAHLRTVCVAIAGTGGMGGLVGQALVRLGIGEIRIADPECFELSNMNRQIACTRATISCSKAVETARLMRAITDDYRLVIYPQGVNSDTAAEFVQGADVVIDEIEFWNISSCIRMHQEARKHSVPVFNCLTVGFATYLHLFTSDSMRVETLLGLSVSEAERLECAVSEGTLTDSERKYLGRVILNCFIPNLPNYYAGIENLYVLERLVKEGIASIIATNPMVAAGIVANQALLYLLSAFGTKRTIPKMPASPGYMFFDAARFETKVILKRKGIADG